MKKKLGRPPLPKGETKEAQIAVRFKPFEYDILSGFAASTGSTASDVVRTAAIAEIQTPPIWVRSKWKWDELNDQSIAFDLTTPNGRLSGLGRLKARPDEYGRIAVDIFSNGPMTNNSAAVVRIWLGPDAVSRIEEHPTQALAKFVLTA
jgi:hypothetical protein